MMSDRRLMLEEVSGFYKKLYGRDSSVETEVEEEEKMGEEEDFPRILRWEVSNEVKRAKQWKAPSPDNIVKKKISRKH